MPALQGSPPRWIPGQAPTTSASPRERPVSHLPSPLFLTSHPEQVHGQCASGNPARMRMHPRLAPSRVLTEPSQAGLTRQPGNPTPIDGQPECEHDHEQDAHYGTEHHECDHQRSTSRRAATMEHSTAASTKQRRPTTGGGAPPTSTTPTTTRTLRRGCHVMDDTKTTTTRVPP